MKTETSQSESRCWRTRGVFADSSCPRLPELGHCRHCPDFSRAGRGLLDREIPEALLDEWTAALAGAKETAATGTVSTLMFRLGGEWFGLKTAFFDEAVALRPAHVVPSRARGDLLGLVNIHGELLPCVDLERLLKVEPAADAAKEPPGLRRLLVAAFEGARYVFPVREIGGIHRLLPADVQPPPITVSKSPSAHTAGLFDWSGRRAALLNEQSLFASLQRSLTP
jgi:chemotaxis-related protein WspD